MVQKDRTRAVCQFLYYLSVLALVLLPTLLVAVWFYADHIAATNGFVPPTAISFPLAVSTKCFMVLLTAMVVAPSYWGLFALRRFLKACCAEDYLSPQNSRFLKRFAFGLIGTALLSPISGAVLSVLLTMHNPPGKKMLAIGISSNQITLAAVGGLLFVLANLLKRASLIADENAQIV